MPRARRSSSVKVECLIVRQLGGKSVGEYFGYSSVLSLDGPSLL